MAYYKTRFIRWLGTLDLLSLGNQICTLNDGLLLSYQLPIAKTFLLKKKQCTVYLNILSNFIGEFLATITMLYVDVSVNYYYYFTLSGFCYNFNCF